jgi:hypothetical protein
MYLTYYPIIVLVIRIYPGTRKYKGKLTYSLQFKTRSMPCITELRSLFYKNKVKVIPQNIYELLTPVALAH